MSRDSGIYYHLLTHHWGHPLEPTADLSVNELMGYHDAFLHPNCDLEYLGADAHIYNYIYHTHSHIKNVAVVNVAVVDFLRKHII